MSDQPRVWAEAETDMLLQLASLSNEPGYYKPDHYGIRIENLVLVEERMIAGGDMPMLGFETLTFAPIDRMMIDLVMLTEAEREWVNAYHAKVRAIVGPQLDGETGLWLDNACAPLS